MGAILSRLALISLGLASTVSAAGPVSRQQWNAELDLGYVSTATPLASWTDGGLGKLRYGGDAGELNASRLLLDYQARLTNSLFAHAVLDYVEDSSSGFGLTESYIEWRPVPASRTIQRWRFGAFYPPFSLENGGPGWSNPFFVASSAINTWLGEEIRSFGAEWSMQRRLFAPGSPQQIRGFAAVFYGNDPAGTLLFWRGWSLSDRQTRLGERLPLPPQPRFDASGAVVGYQPQSLRAFAETDHEPGAYAGLQWRYRHKALIQLAAYDNRADPTSFSNGQWGWRTRFHELAAQISLPRNIGLIVQSLAGRTDWLIATTSTGLTTPSSRVVGDKFDAVFLMLTKSVTASQRVSVRYDDFEYENPVVSYADDGYAWTAAYRVEASRRLSLTAEWLKIRSSRELWTAFYGAPETATERRLRVRFSLHFGANAAP